MRERRPDGKKIEEQTFVQDLKSDKNSILQLVNPN